MQFSAMADFRALRGASGVMCLGCPQSGRQSLDKGILNIIRFFKMPAALLSHSNLIFFSIRLRNGCSMSAYF